MGKTVFNPTWGYKYDWVKAVANDKRQAMCRLCKKNIFLGTMGESALKSHMKSDRHKKLKTASSGTMTATVQCFASGANVTNNTVESEPTTFEDSSVPVHEDNRPTNPSVNIAQSFSNADISKAETIWTLHTVATHASYKGNDKISDIFQKMFPDSEIAKKFSCGEKKTAYIALFGIKCNILFCLFSSTFIYF
jgi:hypothetical protein